MRSVRAYLWLPVVAAAALLAGSATGMGSDESTMPAPRFPEAPSSFGPVVLELFTSQGCSSCPPADKLLPTLAEAGETPVIPLAYHVDYWDYIGWTDPFASKRWTQRQERYARALGARSLYTPQMVVNGSAHANGSDRRQVERLVQSARAYTPAGSPDVTLRRDRRQLHATINVEDIDAEQSSGVEVVAVLFERHLETAVSAGENRGRSLREDYVVRDLKRVMSLAEAVHSSRTATFDLPTINKGGEVGVVVLLQDAETAAIRGAAMAHLAG